LEKGKCLSWTGISKAGDRAIWCDSGTQSHTVFQSDFWSQCQLWDIVMALFEDCDSLSLSD